MPKLEKILLEITQLDPSKECLKFLANRIKSSDYRGYKQKLKSYNNL
ncbi:hypothetical protein HpBT123_14770 [Helicobacter pylori]